MANPKDAEWIRKAKEEYVLLARTLKEKGPKHFARAFLVAGGVVFLVYRGWYRLAEERLRASDSNFESARAKITYSDPFKEARGRLDAILASFPRTKDRSDWLNEEVRATMREAGIVPLQVSAVEEREISGYVLASMTIHCSAAYKQAGEWVARIEHDKYLLHVSELSVTQGGDAAGDGMYNMNVTIMTLFSKGGGQ